MISILLTRSPIKAASGKSISEDLFFDNNILVPIKAACASDYLFYTDCTINKFVNSGNTDISYYTVPGIVRVMYSNNDIGSYSTFSKDRLLTANNDVGSYSAFLHQNINTVTVPAAYIAGGQNTTTVATIDALTFATEICAAEQSTLATARQGMAGISGSLKGYYGGGVAGAYYTNIDGLFFRTGTCSSIGATLSLARAYLAGLNGQNSGYFICGFTSASVYSSKIDGLYYSSETALALTATIGGRSYINGFSSSTKGYAKYGYNGGPVNNCYGFDYASETVVFQTGVLSYRSYYSAFSSSLKGYIAGGETSTVYTKTIENYIFATETNAANAAFLSSLIACACGSESSTKGYTFGGSTTVSLTNSIDGYTYATETNTMTGAVLSSTRRYTATVRSMG